MFDDGRQYWEANYGLTWDHGREVWVDGDGHAYDGSRFGAGSRSVSAAKATPRAPTGGEG